MEFPDEIYVTIEGEEGDQYLSATLNPEANLEGERPIKVATYVKKEVREGKLQPVFTSVVASLLIALFLVLPLTGCTPAQQQTTLQTVQAINAKLPEIASAVDAVSATVAALDPADAAPIATVTANFNTLEATLQAQVTAYLANPSAGTLAQIQAQINAFESAVNTATLQAVSIKNPQTQAQVIAVLKIVLTGVTVLFGMIAPTEPTAMLQQLRETHTVDLARLRPYMDERELRREASGRGVDLDRVFAEAAAAGF